MTPARSQSTPRPRRGLPRWIIPALLVLAGVAVLLYPVVATQYNNLKQHQFAEKYNADVAQLSPDQLDAALARARDYNAHLSGVPILDPWLTQVQNGAADNPEYSNYLGQLNQLDAMARLRMPQTKIDLPIRHGTGDEALATGVGHLYGTSLPVGGEGTHAVLTSHTGFTNATLFDHLHDAKIGDVFYIDVYGQTLTYQVDTIKVVLPNEINDLKVVPGQDLVTLFTCTPYGVNSHRLLVTGHRIPTPPEAAHAPPASASLFHLEWWMYAMLAGALVGVLLVLLIVRRERRRRQPVAHRAAT